MLIAFEGGEGAGKSTQARLLAARLGAVLTFEPGGTPLGAQLRAALLDGDAVDPRAEALLMAADRAQHRSDVIEPALDRGVHVVTDRYLYSSLAYQGYGRGLDVEAVRALSQFAEAPEADLVILLIVPAGVRRERLQGRLDRIEADDEQFHERVEKGFLELAERDPERWVVIAATGAVEDIAELVWTEVNGRL
ncbi:MAG TPA: dTMP kinase [Acidimicrobiales bacterium]|nr:dTMP kinase [Acidimicrobiales bacterium]